MKQKLHSITAGILAMLMLSSCSPSSAETEENLGNAAEMETPDTTPAETELTDNLPSDLDYNGQTINFMYFTGSEARQGLWAEDNGDVVNSAVVQRNTTVEERLNIRMDFIEHDYEADAVKNTLLASDDTFQLMQLSQYRHFPMVVEGLFYDATNLPYTDYDMPWWEKDIMNEMSPMGDQVYALLGDISYNLINRMGCMFYNKELYANVYGDGDTLYQTVLDGKWTMDALMEASAALYEDTNGNGTIDRDDVLGYGTFFGWIGEMIFYCGGARLSTRDADGYPTVNPVSELSLSIADKMLEMYYQTPGGYLYDYNVDHTNIINNFIAGSVAFYYGVFSYAATFREMESDYGIIPYPKCDETVENYTSLITDDLRYVCLPYYIGDDTAEMLGATVEAMASEGYRTTRPAFYETAMKSKYSRDELSGQVIDILHDSMFTEFTYLFNSLMSYAGHIGREVVGRNQNLITSWWASNEKKVAQSIEDLIAATQNQG